MRFILTAHFQRLLPATRLGATEPAVQVWEDTYLAEFLLEKVNGLCVCKRELERERGTGFVVLSTGSTRSLVSTICQCPYGNSHFQRWPLRGWFLPRVIK